MPPPISILSFDRDAPEMEAFLELPGRMPGADPVSSASREVSRALFSADHPFFREGEERYFLARRGERLVARCAAIVNRRLLEREPGVGLIGFFESEHEPDACAAMLAEARAWLAAHGCPRARGPVDRDTWHRYRVLADGFDGERVFLEPCNPPWYADLYRRAGFTIEIPYATVEVGDPPRHAERYAPMVERCARRGAVLRGFAPDQFDAELALLHRLTLEIFAENHGYSPISFEEFAALYRPVRAGIDPAFVRLAFDADGAPVGYLFAFADPFSLRSPRGPALNIKTLGVTPRRRAHGIGQALVGQVYRAAVERGFPRVRHCLMKEDNTSRRYDAGAGTAIKRYLLFESP